MRYLVDANILIYTRDFRDPRKQRLATEWMMALTEREAVVVNLQVLNEVRHVALRKFGEWSAADIRRWTDELAAFGDSPIDAEIARAAWPIQARYGFSWFDCLILSSADRLSCSHVLTEDMGANRKVGSLTLVNPFATALSDATLEH